jgi:3-(3-hydroxy-phenyl)propionate hydroxylase
MFHQPALETALRDRLDASPLADVRLGCAFQGFEQDAEGVVAVQAGPDGERTIRARYLVGCDGASSAVRGACGVRFDDYGFDEPWLVIDARLGPNARPPALNLQICDPARPTTCVLMGPGRHRWEFMLLPGETAETVSGDAFIANLLRPWDCDDVVLERRAVYRFHGLVALSWRKGRVLLAGDAAHQTPPFAGQGMCSGLRDAANVAWKLAAVMQDGADPALLDTYQSEREPHVRSVIERAIMMGRVVCTLDPAAAAARDADLIARRQSGAPPPPLGDPDLARGFLLADSAGAGELFPQPWAVVGDAALKLDDVLGPGPWLITREPAPAAPRGAGLRRFDLDSDSRLAPFREPLRAWLERRSAEAVLVRPDRYVFGTGAAAMLADAFARQLGSSAPSSVEA